MRKLVLTLSILLSVLALPANAKGRIARHPTFYYNIDLGYGNMYAFALSSCLTGTLNYLIDRPLFENAYEYNIPCFTSSSGMTYSDYKTFGITKNDFLKNVKTGLKLGYHSDYLGLCNYIVYASLHYKHDVYLLQSDVEGTHDSNRLMPGVGASLIIGRIHDDGIRVRLDAGLRYSLPMSHISNYAVDKTQCNSGFISHFGVKIIGDNMFQNLGLYVDISHFNMLNRRYTNNGILVYEGIRYQPISIGLTWTITPDQIYMR